MRTNAENVIISNLFLSCSSLARPSMLVGVWHDSRLISLAITEADRIE